MDFHYFYFVSIFTAFFILSNKNAQIHKNRTQSMLFNCLFLTLYGCYGIRLYSTEIDRHTYYASFDTLLLIF